MQKSVLAATAVVIFLAPLVAFGAGFAKQSLFLSKSSVTEGDVVLIHAVVSTESAFSGKLDFSEGANPIGTVPVKLAAGEAQAVSVSWKPASGSHTVVAELKNGTDVVEKQSSVFVINPKPQPAATASANSSSGGTASVESSRSIQNGIASYSPQTAAVTEPFFTLVDGGRSKAADIIDQQLSNTKSNLEQSGGTVLSAQTTKNAASDPGGTFWRILETLYLYLLTILGFIVGSAGVFYPLLAVIFLYLLWKLFRRFRRPAY